MPSQHRSTQSSGRSAANDSSPAAGSSDTDKTADIAAEQDYVSGLYRQLDDERELATGRLTTALRQTGGTPQARSEREASTTLYSERLAQLNSVEQGLCFGRLDFGDERAEENPTYVGRLGLFDEADDYRPLLLDWRAPAARPFYLATAAAPDEQDRKSVV